MADEPDKPEMEIFRSPETFKDSFNPMRDGWERYRWRKSVNSNLCLSDDPAKLLILEIKPKVYTYCECFFLFCDWIEMSFYH